MWGSKEGEKTPQEPGGTPVDWFNYREQQKQMLHFMQQCREYNPAKHEDVKQ